MSIAKVKIHCKYNLKVLKIIEIMFKKLQLLFNIFLVCLIIMVTLICFKFFMFSFSGSIQIIYIDTKSPSHFAVGRNFLSIALDTFVIANSFRGFNMSDPKLIQMVKYLSPGYIRFGGNLADKLIFSPEEIDNDFEAFQFYFNKSYTDNVDYILASNFTMTGLQWLKLLNFTAKVHLDPIFDLNVLIRFRNGSWDYINAKSLITFSQKHNMKVHWQLGNEPNSFKHKFNQVVNASQLAKDFRQLRLILDETLLYKSSLLLGPDVTRPLISNKKSENYLRKFLKYSGNVISAVTWHQYYLNGHTAHASDFLNSSTFDLLEDQISIIMNIVKSSPVPKSAVWLGETSSAYGSGAPNLSNTFIGSFLWIDKLGLAAKMGISTVIRQSIFEGYYALLDENYDPNPDWWVSILYKDLVGGSTVPYFTDTTSKVRLYVHCTKTSFLDGMLPSITIFGINLESHIANLSIEGLSPIYLTKMFMIYTYELTHDNTITSKGIKLNGQLLKMLPNNTLPIFVPKIQYIKSFIAMPPLSVVFWVIPTSKLKACQ